MSEFAEIEGEGAAHAWTEEEVAAARECKALLRKDAKFDQSFCVDDCEATNRAIFLTCVNCKFRPDKAADKLQKWTAEMRDNFKITSFADVYGGLGTDGAGADAEWANMTPLFTAYVFLYIHAMSLCLSPTLLHSLTPPYPPKPTGTRAAVRICKAGVLCGSKHGIPPSRRSVMR